MTINFAQVIAKKYRPDLGRRNFFGHAIAGNLLPAVVLTALSCVDALAAPVDQSCGNALKSISLGNPLARITLVKEFKAGSAMPPSSSTPPTRTVAPVDLCLVKILVGPGNPGPAGSKSTSAGIGIEVLLPTRQNWNKRYVAYGNGGYAGGGGYTSMSRISSSIIESLYAAKLGYVTSATDDGHIGDDSDSVAGLRGSFAMRPDGTLNQPLLRDFAYRALHEMAVMTKAIAKSYYGVVPRFSYWNGMSSGGREALMLAQRYPTDFNGIISAMPAINWPSFIPSIMWPQIVMRQDLGNPIAEDKLQAVYEASVAACDTDLTGRHDGYINDPASCRYDPSKDVALLCKANGGNNTTSHCLTLAEARAVNKIWYGPRVDGAMVDPAIDNGWNVAGLAAGQLWYGYPRGVLLHNSPHSFGTGMAGLTPFTIGSDWLPLVLLDPAYGTPDFTNETGDGRDLWKSIGYTGALSFPGVLVKSQTMFHDLIATDDPDLTQFKKNGGKLIHWHGIADNIIPALGSVQYYERVKNRMGGSTATQEFYRFYLVPGMGHAATAGPGTTPPIPGGDLTSYVGPNNALLHTLREWVENGKAPDSIAAQWGTGAAPSRSRPWCLYPKKLKYLGGEIKLSTSYTCS